MPSRYISDSVVVQAYADAKALRDEGHFLLAVDILAQQTHLPAFVCETACERACARGLISWDGYASLGWPSPLGEELLRTKRGEPKPDSKLRYA